MRNKMNIDVIKQLISDSSLETKIYIGSDSQRVKKNGVWYADYCVVVVVHKDGKHGCKVFGEVDRERDYDQRMDRPATRLMNEVYRASALYLKLADAIGDRHAEVHLDINPDIRYGSSCVIQQAVGYIKGTCSVEPRVKPESFAATHCSDHLLKIQQSMKGMSAAFSS